MGWRVHNIIGSLLGSLGTSLLIAAYLRGQVVLDPFQNFVWIAGIQVFGFLSGFVIGRSGAPFIVVRILAVSAAYALFIVAVLQPVPPLTYQGAFEVVFGVEATAQVFTWVLLRLKG